MNKRYLAIGETAFAVLGILFFSKSIPKVFFSDTVTSLIRYALWLGSTLLLMYRWKSTYAVAKRSPMIWIIIGLSFFSVTWSGNPEFTSLVNREVIYMGTFALYLASRFRLREQLYLLAFTLAGVAVASALLAVGLPAVGVDQEIFVGAWRGVYTHKNTLGKFMSMSTLAFAVLVCDKKFYVDRLYQILTWGGLCLSLGMVVMTTSQTSLLVSLMSVFLLYVYRLYQKQGNVRKLYLEVTFLIIFVVGFTVFSNWEAILTSMGRDITLTGRTDIWASSITELGKRPWLGFGRGTFWAPGSYWARVAGSAVGRLYIPPHAHNGYLDLALEVGYIGLICFFISFVSTYRHAITRSFVSTAPKDLWPLAFLSWLAIYNLTESMLMFQENLYWPLYMSMALCAKPTGRAVHLRVKKAYQSANSSLAKT